MKFIFKLHPSRDIISIACGKTLKSVWDSCSQMVPLTCT